MSDLEQYVERRKQTDSEFAEGFESGYSSFKLGVLLVQAREEVGLTQEDLAHRLDLDESMISRIESHAEDTDISTLERYAEALGKRLCVELK